MGDEGAPDAVADVVTLFDCVRRRQRETTWRSVEARSSRPPVVAPAYAGWMVPGPGEPAAADGLRPLGALRRELADLVADAPIGSYARQQIVLWYGLDGFPLGNAVGEGDLRGAVERRTGRRPGPRDRRRAEAALAAHVPPRPEAVARRYGPVPDPRGDDWYRTLSEGRRALLWPRAVGRAAALASIAAPEERFQSRLLAEVDRLAVVAATVDDVSRRAREPRARALVAVALWEEHHARPARRRAETRPDLDRVQAEVDALAGSRSTAEAGRVARDLWAGLEPHLGPDPDRREIPVLAGLSAALRRSEDVTVTRLATTLAHRHPRRPWAVDGLLDAVMVLAPLGHEAPARSLLGKARLLAPALGSKGNAEERAEQREYLHVVDLAETALHRRVVEARMQVAWAPGVPVDPDALLGDTADLDRLRKGARRLLEVDATPDRGGDATELWIARARLRQVELEQLWLLADSGRRHDRDRWRARMRRVDDDLAWLRRGAVAPARGRAAYHAEVLRQQLAKAVLTQRILRGDARGAVAWMRVVMAQGSTVSRSSPVAGILLSEPRRGANPLLTGVVRDAAEAALADGLDRQGAVAPDPRLLHYEAQAQRVRRRR